MEEVKTTLNSKELKLRVLDSKDGGSSDILMERENMQKGSCCHGRKPRRLVCYHCHKEEHYKRDCPELNENGLEDTSYSENVVVDIADIL